MGKPAPLPRAYELARKILGPDFITPQELASARGVGQPKRNQLERYEEEMPSDVEVLERYKASNAMCLPLPLKPKSIMTIRELGTDFFATKHWSWYAMQSQTFSYETMVGSTGSPWLALMMAPLPQSFNRTEKEQGALLKPLGVMPTAVEVVWGLAVYKWVRGKLLLPDASVRTSCKASNKEERVCVGNTASGIDIRPRKDNEVLYNLGALAKIELVQT